jgi:hypothetical protein
MRAASQTGSLGWRTSELNWRTIIALALGSRALRSSRVSHSSQRGVRLFCVFVHEGDIRRQPAEVVDCKEGERDSEKEGKVVLKNIWKSVVQHSEGAGRRGSSSSQTMHRPQDQECHEVQPGASDAEGGAPPEQGPQPKSGGEACE